MPFKEDGVIVILSSPSGAGKTTLSKLLAENKNFHISVSHTTRRPRNNEVHGEDYFFVKPEEFKSLIDMLVTIRVGPVASSSAPPHV